MRPTVSAICAIALAAGVTACGAEKRPAAVGSAENPVTAVISKENTKERANEGAARSAPGAQAAAAVPAAAPSHLEPCSLVSRARAAAIIGEAVRRPTETTQGPTCVYRTVKGKATVTVGVQSMDFQPVRKQMHGVRKIRVGGRTAYCGDYGQAMLYAPLRSGRVLTVSAACGIATKFAAQALRRLG